VNCLDYRRILLSGTGESDAMRAHRTGCASCAELLREQDAFEGSLRGAFAVPVPDRLAERLLESAPAVPGGRAGRFQDRRRFLAAATAAAAAIGLGLYAWRGRDDPMALACIDFVMKDEAKSIMMGAMPRAEAKRMLADTLPLERIERVGSIKHIAPCPLGEGTAYHVVLMVPQDKVTLLVMPDTPMPARGRAVQHGMYASVIPLRKGSVGIVGANAAVVDSVAGALRG
jgi:hypothetical protein